MAKRITKMFECPQCKEQAEIEMWDSVNGTLNPQLKAHLLDGTLFNWTCPHCGKTVRILYPLLYIDMVKQFLVWFGKPEARNPELYEKMTLDGYEFRNARNYNELIEKIVVMENGLDDHTLELMKFSIAQSILKQTEGGTKGPLPAGLMFHAITEEAIQFSVFFKDGSARGTQVPVTTYEKMREDIMENPGIKKVLENSAGKFQSVDSLWARKAVELMAAQKKMEE